MGADEAVRAGINSVNQTREAVQGSFEATAAKVEYSEHWPPDDPVLLAGNELAELKNAGVDVWKGYDSVRLNSLKDQPPQKRPIYGGFTPNNQDWPVRRTDIEDSAEVLGQPAVVQVYVDMGDGSKNTLVNSLETIKDAEAIPFVTLMPGEAHAWNQPDNEDFKKYSLENIARGDHDEKFRDYAKILKNYEEGVMLRMFHEGNGDPQWPYPWMTQEHNGQRVNGNTPEQFVEAWRHVVDIFREEGADNVSFVLNFDAADHTEEETLRALWPEKEGDRQPYVHWIGISGYDAYGHPYGADIFTRFKEVYNNSLKFAGDKPFCIPEIGTRLEDKNQFLEDLYTKFLPYYCPQVQMVLYFNKQKSDEANDWRIKNEDGSAEVAKRITSSKFYLEGRQVPKVKRGKVPIAKELLGL